MRRTLENNTKENLNKMLDISIQLAKEFFRDKVDKGGHPYINHLLAVSNKCTSIDSKIVGVLHDIIEDTKITREELGKFIFDDLVDAIEIVSRKEKETYKQFIERIAMSNNKIAIEVKISDLENNMDLTRLPEIEPKDIERVNKYKKAWNRLTRI